MFVLKNTMELMDKKDEEINDLKDEVRELRVDKRELERKVERAERKEEWETEKVKNEVRKKMEKALIESDLKRTEAVAKLNTYIDMDTKDERKHIQDMLEKAIEALGKQKEVKIVKE